MRCFIFVVIRDDDSQRTRPAFIDQFVNRRRVDRRVVGEEPLLRDVDRKGFVFRPALDLPQTRHRLFIVKIRRDPVNGFRRKHDKTSLPDDIGAIADPV